MKISDALGVPSSKLWACGVFDSYVGIDSRLHIDPALLREARVPEFKKSWARLEEYFKGVFVFLTTSTPESKLENQGISRLIFPEIDIAALGYSDGKSRGHGVSRKLATQIFYTAREIVAAGIKDPAIFELAVIFEEDFGPDLISDMTLWIILDDVSTYNQRVCKTLGIPCKEILVKGRKINAALSKSTEKSILLLPRSLLGDLPEATSYGDIGEVAAYNRAVRESLSKLLGTSWKKLVKDYGKKEIKQLILQDPELLKELLKAYKSTDVKSYDFISDPLGEIVWESIGKKKATANKLKLDTPRSADEIPAVISKIVQKFKLLIEQNALHKVLYSNGGKQRPEKFSQLLFFAIADSYCEANNLDLSAEPNAGRGPVDFKVSKGYQGRALVELKLSSNNKGIDGLLKQLPTYVEAEKADYSCFVMIVVGPTRTKVDEMVTERNRLLTAGNLVPELVIINAYEAHRAPSASKLRWQG